MRQVLVPLVSSILYLVSSTTSGQVAFTPRVSNYYDNVFQRAIDPNIAFEDFTVAQMADLTEQLQEVFGPTASIATTNADTAASTGQVDFTLAGATLAFLLPNDRTQLAFTLLTGDGTTDSRQVTHSTVEFTLGPFATTDLWSGTITNRYEIDRQDFEFTVQHRLSETLSLIGGVRIEQSDVKVAFEGVTQRSTNMLNLAALVFGGPISINLAEPVSGSAEMTTENRLYSLRFGAAAYAPVGERSLFYVNGLIHVTSEKSDEFVITSDGNIPGFSSGAAGIPEADQQYFGPDVTVGYVYRFGDHVDFDVRYRATAYFLSDDSGNPRVNHGFSMGVSFWFGR